MVETKKIIYTLVRTGTASTAKYRSNMKSLFIRRHGLPLEYRGQHERCDVLADKALAYARLIGDELTYELRTGAGVCVERGSVLTITERTIDYGKTS